MPQVKRTKTSIKYPYHENYVTIIYLTVRFSNNGFLHAGFDSIQGIRQFDDLTRTNCASMKFMIV